MEESGRDNNKCVDRSGEKKKVKEKRGREREIPLRKVTESRRIYQK